MTPRALVDWTQPSPDAKYHSVNFLNVTTPDDKGTVESRFTPPTADSEVAIKWMRLAVGSVAASANRTDPAMLTPTIGGLRSLLQNADRDVDSLKDVLQATGA